MLNPISTYRIQFHAAFTFKDFERIIPYLQQLGVSTIYASPIMEATPGSTHGYDTVNPQRINPEIGTLEELKAIAKKLSQLKIRWIQDIVPNHMAFHPNNLWLMDVLEKGTESAYAEFFDVNWSGDKDLPLMLPFLSGTLEEEIAQGVLQLINRDGKIKLKYHEMEWPVNAAVNNIDMPLKAAIDLQYYRPCHWGETSYRINFRRFFTVNSLICLNIQYQETFDAYHQFLKSLLDARVFQGLRVDHIDGLYDPETYMERLRNLAGSETYIIVEKILQKGEQIHRSWPVEGTTGYDFLALINNLYTYKDAEKDFNGYYKQLTGDKRAVAEKIIDEKTAILENYMAGELDNLSKLFLNLNLADAEEINALKNDSLKNAIGQLLIHCPVYRFYGNRFPLSGDNYTGLKELIKEISSNKSLRAAVKLLEKVLLDRPQLGDEAYNNRAQQFYLRCMQFTGPLMAKGLEDTLMYTHHNFIGHNEVGDSPAAFGRSIKVIHNEMLIRQKYWPLTLNGSSTHDTKRGEDVRARLNVLSALPEEWIRKVEEWTGFNADSSVSLDPSDEYFIYQTLIGSYPMPGMPEDNYTERLQAYLEKALREGKRNSSWSLPDKSYEQVVKDFAVGLLDQTKDFWKSFIVLHNKVSDFGILNSLGQLLLKFTCPGQPDVYQGTELWDLNLVDPDNRRPVDYHQREKWLQEIRNTGVFIQELWKERYNGKIKLLLLNMLLEQRNLMPEFFAASAYIPLKVKGKYARHIFAFARREGQQWLITAVPLHLAKLTAERWEDPTALDWKDTRIIVPAVASLKWVNVLTGEKGIADEAVFPVADIFSGFPLALLKLEQLKNERAAGILLHITSLPSAFGIGDLGPEAEKFADFLAHSGQKYWQLLPLNPITAEQNFSPYSAVSAIAGNILLISPELLVRDGLLARKEIKRLASSIKGKLNFERVSDLKNELLDKAYISFNKLCDDTMFHQFDKFCEREASWLDDFALYIVLKQYHGFSPWYEWELGYKFRHQDTINAFAVREEEKLKVVKWRQFIFFKQWDGLRAYTRKLGIKFCGDLPFYVSYDSAEVWSHRQIFDLNKEGDILRVAGVPPDYFNVDGQLWGMPVYRWKTLKKQGYKWWLDRIRKNMALYDLLRLDHFRAFYDYWGVPAGETTAVNGAWEIGPGADFLMALMADFPDLPFIAEDLGEIDPAVYKLRDDFKLAGMKVLQFAFGKDMGRSEHIPHRFNSANFVVYTGTHDNNTTVGWYMKETGKMERKHLTQYAGSLVDRKNAHTVLARMAYSSIAKIVILPMQDVLGLGGRARMNRPASVKRNWIWRLKEIPGKEVRKKLKKLAKVYGRV